MLWQRYIFLVVGLALMVFRQAICRRAYQDAGRFLGQRNPKQSEPLLILFGAFLVGVGLLTLIL